jgi:hypothetical protein
MNSYNIQTKGRVADILYETLNHNYNYDHLRNRVIKDMLWAATEDGNNGRSYKYKLPFWSVASQANYNHNNVTGFRHEHMYPKRLLKDRIINSGPPYNRDSIFQELSSYSFAAVLTTNDDDNLRTKGLSQKLPEIFEDTFKIRDQQIQALPNNQLNGFQIVPGYELIVHSNVSLQQIITVLSELPGYNYEDIVTDFHVFARYIAARIQIKFISLNNGQPNFNNIYLLQDQGGTMVLDMNLIRNLEYIGW